MVKGHVIQQLQPLCRSIESGVRHRPADKGADAGASVRQKIVKRDQRRRVWRFALCCLHVDRLDRRFGLEAPELTCSGGAAEMALGLNHQFLSPETAVLIAEGHIFAFRPSPRSSARLAVKHQGHQAARLWLIGQHLHHQPAEIERFLRQPGPGLAAFDHVPAGSESGVDGGIAGHQLKTPSVEQTPVRFDRFFVDTFGRPPF